MISNETRLRLHDIASRIAEHEEVSLEEMTFITKWAQHNATAATILNRARRQATLGKMPEGSLDAFMCDMNLGDPDPQSHLLGPQDPITLAEWFMRPKWFRGDQ
jgi:predicted phage gp36 major capsid-like protein